MKNTIISCIVAILCVVALCATYAGCTPATQSEAAAVAVDEYLTEEEAAEYIGVTDEVMTMMREKLGFFKGAYMTYIYLDANGNEVTDIVYNKTELDKAVKTLMADKNALSFKFLQEKTEK